MLAVLPHLRWALKYGFDECSEPPEAISAELEQVCHDLLMHSSQLWGTGAAGIYPAVGNENVGEDLAL